MDVPLSFTHRFEPALRPGVSPLLLLHGTGGDAHSLLNPLFSDVLFVPGFFCIANPFN